MKAFVGIDYSMTCPAICVHLGGVWNPQNCIYYFLDKVVSHNREFSHGVRGDLLRSDGMNDEQRYDHISNWAMNILSQFKGVKLYVGIEDYAFAAKGQVFNIGENTGLLKHKLWKEGIEFRKYAPNSIKAVAGSGGNDKDAMYQAFKADTGIDLFNMITPKKKAVGSPVGDIADSYFICKKSYLDYEEGLFVSQK